MEAQVPYIKWHSTAGPAYPQIWSPQIRRAHCIGFERKGNRGMSEIWEVEMLEKPTFNHNGKNKLTEKHAWICSPFTLL